MRIYKLTKVGVIAYLLLFKAFTGYCITIQEICDKVNGSTVKNRGSQLQVTFGIEKNNSEIKVTAYGSSLVEEKTFKETTSNESPFTKVIQEFSTNGYKSYNEGGLHNGQHVVSEADLRTNEEPVSDVAIFASRFYQTRLLLLLKEPAITNVQYEGETVYAIKGLFTVQGLAHVNVILFFAKSDFLLLGEEFYSKEESLGNVKLIATRTTASQSDWPYASIHYEIASHGSLLSQAVVPVSTKRIPIESDASPYELIIPAKTLVTDERFGYPVCYVMGSTPHLTDKDIAKMATDPDYRTNSYFLGFYHITKSASTFNQSKRVATILVIFAITLLPLLAILWQRKRGVRP